MLVGRESERAVLHGLVERAGHGLAGSLVVRGEPGVGKSALLDDLAYATPEANVLRTQGVEVESPLAFAALHRLLRPLMRLRDGLPAPQAQALRVAFGEQDGVSVEPFLVGVATLSVLTTAAEEGLVLCIVDDAHWLDPASAAALFFCARRLGADRVVLVFGVRDGAGATFDPQGLDELVVTGLDPDASRILLDQNLGADVAEAVVERLVVETAGNPLALLELPGELSAAELRGESALPVQLSLSAHVERVFVDRARRLPASVQSLLLLATADDTGESTVLHRAADGLGLTNTDMQTALDSGLIVGDGVSFAVRHPLVRSAIYQAASDDDRRRVHRALADVLADTGDADREAWHRAAAAVGPDAQVVAALELVGSRALRRGGYVAALTAYERAATLSVDVQQRARLMYAAARSAWACGRASEATLLLAAAREAADDPVLLCDIARLKGHIEVNLGSAAKAHRIFVEAAQAVFAVDPDRALEIGTAAAVMRTFGADSGTPLPSSRLLTAAASNDSPRTRCLRHLLTSMTLTADESWATAVKELDLALVSGEQVDDRDVLWNLANAALQLGDDPAQQRFYSYALSRAREAGAATAVVYCLQRLCFGYFLAGDHASVRSSAEEAIALGQSIGQPAMTPPSTAWLTLLAALQGADDYEDRLHRLEELVAEHPLGILTDPVHDLTRWAKGLHALSGGDSFGALHHLARFRLPVLARMSAPERIEAAVRSGETAVAGELVEELAAFAADTDRTWAHATVAFGRALIAEPDEAEPWFEESVSQHARAGRAFDAARTHLAYGEWLRRSGRRVDARAHLRHALEAFQDVRAAPLSARADQELRASGETARKRDPSTLVKLTPMELKIAQLVSSGLSNKDVAAQCWISPRTVAFHLRNVFAKAGVTSRGELAQLDLA